MLFEPGSRSGFRAVRAWRRAESARHELEFGVLLEDSPQRIIPESGADTARTLNPTPAHAPPVSKNPMGRHGTPHNEIGRHRARTGLDLFAACTGRFPPNRRRPLRGSNLVLGFGEDKLDERNYLTNDIVDAGNLSFRDWDGLGFLCKRGNRVCVHLQKVVVC